MNKPDLTKLLKTAQATVTKHSPEILTGLGIAGMITTTVLAVKATPKALLLLEDARHEKGTKLTKTEKVKTAWKPYIPAAVTGTASIVCLIGASSVNAKRNAALATAYQLSTTALADYKETVVETIGEKKEKTIREKVAQKKIDDTPVATTTVYNTGKGGTLCFDPQFGQYFRCNIDSIDKAVNKLNNRMVSGHSEYISLNDFYTEIGVNRISMGDNLGWNIGRDGLIDIEHNTAIVTDDGEPCIVITYNVAPTYDYFKINTR